MALRVVDLLYADFCEVRGGGHSHSSSSSSVTHAHDWSGPYLTCFILFQIMSLSLLIFSSVSCFVPPMSKRQMQRKRTTGCFQKFSRFMSWCDLDLGAVPAIHIGSRHRAKKQRINGDDDDDDESVGQQAVVKVKNDGQTKTLAGSLITLFALWFMFGALLYMYSPEYRPFVPSMWISESQDVSSALSIKSLFKAAVVVKMRLTKDDCALYYTKTTIDIQSYPFPRVSPTTYHSFLSDRTYHCFIYREWEMDSVSYPARQNSLRIALDMQEVTIGDVISPGVLSVVSLPVNTRAEDDPHNGYPPTLVETQPQPMVDYLLRMGRFCSQFHMHHTNKPMSLVAHAKSFQYPFRSRDSNATVDEASVMSNMIHFPQQFMRPGTTSYAGRTDARIEIDFAQRGVYYIRDHHSPAAQNAFVTIVVIICTLVAWTWARNLARVITHHFQRYAMARIQTLCTLLIITGGFYGLLGYEIWLGQLFEQGSLTTSFVMSGIAHSSLYSLFLFLHVLIFHARYSRMNNKEAPVEDDESISLFESTNNHRNSVSTIIHHATTETMHASSLGGVQSIYPRDQAIPHQQQRE